MPDFSKKQPFQVYTVIGVKDAYAVASGDKMTNSEFNERDAVDYFKSKGVPVFQLVAPVDRLSDEVSDEKVESPATKLARKHSSSGRSFSNK